MANLSLDYLVYPYGTETQVFPEYLRMSSEKHQRRVKLMRWMSEDYMPQCFLRMNVDKPSACPSCAMPYNPRLVYSIYAAEVCHTFNKASMSPRHSFVASPNQKSNQFDIRATKCGHQHCKTRHD